MRQKRIRTDSVVIRKADSIWAQFPQFQPFDDYAELLAAMKAVM
jgi:hypothetical protein